ncbi:hypothetical protein PORY_001615, partial [Pneumocystis oryctolagi]
TLHVVVILIFISLKYSKILQKIKLRIRIPIFTENLNNFKNNVSTSTRDCNFCDGHFCGRHRQLENHACTGLQECRQQSHERNRTKLQKEQCVASKV